MWKFAEDPIRTNEMFPRSVFESISELETMNISLQARNSSLFLEITFDLFLDEFCLRLVIFYLTQLKPNCLSLRHKYIENH